MADEKTDKITQSLFTAFCVACFLMAVVLIAAVVLLCVNIFSFMFGYESTDNVVSAVFGIVGWTFCIIGFPIICAIAIVGIVFFIYYGYCVLKSRRRAISECFNEIKEATEKTAAVALVNVLASFFIVWFIYNDILNLLVLGVIPLTFGIAFLVFDIICAKRLKRSKCDK